MSLKTEAVFFKGGGQNTCPEVSSERTRKTGPGKDFLESKERSQIEG